MTPHLPRLPRVRRPPRGGAVTAPRLCLSTSAQVARPGPQTPQEDPAMPTPCLLCETPYGKRRRCLCQRCYRKLRECGVPLPPRQRSGPVPWTVETAFERWARTWPARHREALLRALQAVAL